MKKSWLALLLVLCFAHPAASAMVIKLGVVTKPGSAQNIVAEKFKELIEQRSNGEIAVKINPKLRIAATHTSHPLLRPCLTA